MGQKLKQKKREQQHEKNEIGCCYYHYIAVVYDLRSYNQNEPADSSSRLVTVYVQLSYGIVIDIHTCSREKKTRDITIKPFVARKQHVKPNNRLASDYYTVAAGNNNNT